MLRTALCGVALAGAAPALACSVVAPDPHAPPPVPPTAEETARLVAQTVAIKTDQLIASLAGADTVFVGIALDTKATRDAGRKTRFRIVERIAGRLWGRVKTLHWTETSYDDGCQAYSNAFQLQSTYLIALDDGRVHYARRMDDPQRPELFTFEAALQVAREATRAGNVRVDSRVDLGRWHSANRRECRRAPPGVTTVRVLSADLRITRQSGEKHSQRPRRAVDSAGVAGMAAHGQSPGGRWLAEHLSVGSPLRP